MRIACPLSSGNRLTSAMTDPPLLRIGSTSIGSAESNTSHTVSARRNNAAGVAAAKENVRFRPSLVRVAPATAAPSPAPAAGGGLVSACGSGAAAVIFCGISTAAAGISFAEGSGFGCLGGGQYFRCRFGFDLDPGVFG